MADIKSINGNPIVPESVADGAVTPQSLSDEVIHGQYPSLSVGRADALTGADSTAQWATRESTGSGSATVRSVQGAAVVWNQMVQNGDFATQSVWSTNNATWSVSDGVATITPNGSYARLNQTVPTSIQGHKYLLTAEIKKTTAIEVIAINAINKTVWSPASEAVNEWVRYSAIKTAGDTQSTAVYVCDSQLKDTEEEYAVRYVRNVMLFDLTAMFGAGNEPSTVAEFEAMYPEAYYPYSAPVLKPVQIAGIQSKDAQGGELDAIEWETQTLRAAGSVADVLYADHVDVNVGEVTLGANNCTVAYTDAGTNQTRVQVSVTDWDGKGGPNVTSDQFVTGPADWNHITLGTCRATTSGFFLGLPATVTNNTQAKAWIVEHAPKFYYELATPTTTPISPALPMTYRVQAGGSESIIVPEGEISAIPVLTIAEGESVADVVMDALACIATPDGPTATANHSVGTYLTMQGKLYKVTSAIAVGESIVAGTNVSQTTVMAELLALTQ